MMAVFPTSDSFTRFTAAAKNQASLQSFISFAYANDIIADMGEASLETLANIYKLLSFRQCSLIK